MFVKYRDGIVLEYPILDIRSMFPNTSLPEDLSNNLPEDYYYVKDTSIPEYNSITQKLVELDPELKSEKFYRKYAVVDLTENELRSSLDLVKSRLTTALASKLNKFASERGYSSIESLVSYANSTNPTFKWEAEQGILARDKAWTELFDIFNGIDNGNIPLTSISELELLISDVIWPEQP